MDADDLRQDDDEKKDERRFILALVFHIRFWRHLKDIFNIAAFLLLGSLKYNWPRGQRPKLARTDDEKYDGLLIIQATDERARELAKDPRYLSFAGGVGFDEHRPGGGRDEKTSFERFLEDLFTSKWRFNLHKRLIKDVERENTRPPHERWSLGRLWKIIDTYEIDPPTRSDDDEGWRRLNDHVWNSVSLAKKIFRADEADQRAYWSCPHEVSRGMVNGSGVNLYPMHEIVLACADSDNRKLPGHLANHGCMMKIIQPGKPDREKHVKAAVVLQRKLDGGYLIAPQKIEIAIIDGSKALADPAFMVEFMKAIFQQWPPAMAMITAQPAALEQFLAAVKRVEEPSKILFTTPDKNPVELVPGFDIRVERDVTGVCKYFLCLDFGILSLPEIAKYVGLAEARMRGLSEAECRELPAKNEEVVAQGEGNLPGSEDTWFLFAPKKKQEEDGGGTKILVGGGTDTHVAPKSRLTLRGKTEMRDGKEIVVEEGVLQAVQRAIYLTAPAFLLRKKNVPAAAPTTGSITEEQREMAKIAVSPVEVEDGAP